MTSLKTSIKTITYLSDIGCLEIQGASLAGSNIDTSMHQNHIDVSHAFDKESLTAGNLQ